MKCDPLYLKKEISSAIYHLTQAQESIYSYFIGEDIEIPYSSWVDDLTLSKEILLDILHDRKFEAFCKKEKEYFNRMEKELGL